MLVKHAASTSENRKARPKIRAGCLSWPQMGYHRPSQRCKAFKNRTLEYQGRPRANEANAAANTAHQLIPAMTCSFRKRATRDGHP
jgi:hypothetical protein